ncbi:MAG: insulinase family protein [Cyanobacteria bacterium SZAS LIN-2]|nr:insulinase family protein [Cyanobacteria bacterium SZAS LIN-2]
MNQMKNPIKKLSSTLLTSLLLAPTLATAVNMASIAGLTTQPALAATAKKAAAKTGKAAAPVKAKAPAIPAPGDLASSGLVAPAPNMPVEPWRKNKPAVPAPRPFQLPKVSTYTMDNGLVVETVEDHRFPFVTLYLGFHSGTSQEPQDMIGLSSMTSDLLTEGTKTKTSKQIAEAVDFIGGALGASSDFDYTLVSGSALSDYGDRLVSLMSDVVLNPSFPQEELDLNKTNLIQELTMKRSDPNFLVQERFSKVVFGSHPYSVVAPNETSINRISQKDLIDYHAKTYIPNNAFMIIVGDFNPDKMKDLISKNFGSQWKQGKVETATMPATPNQDGRKIYLVDRPGSVQTAIKVGNIGIQRKDPNYFPLLVMNQILGGAANARLFLNIREAKGYTYGAYSRMSARKEKGSFSAEASVRTDVTAPSLQEFLYELERIRNVKVTDAEITSAKNYLAGSFQLGLETQGGLAQRLLEAKLYNLPDNYLETYADKVMAVSVDDVRASARNLIDTKNLVITAVGDAKKIKQDLELFAPVSVYDTQGKLAGEEKPKSVN